MCTIISIPTNNDKIYKCIDVNVSNKNGLLRINKRISYVYYNKKAVLYKNVFRLVLNAFKLSLSLTDFGRLFQIVGADTANARSPKLLVLVLGILRRFLSLLRSGYLPGCCSSIRSHRYGGAIPLVTL